MGLEIVEFKKNVHASLEKIVLEKINAIQQNLASLKESGANETKSTAGDKHETALAMLQIEQANNRTQLAHLLSQQAAVQKIDVSIISNKIALGSLVQSNKGYFYISVALGKFLVNAQLVYAVSQEAPLGKMIMGKQAGESVTVNNMEYIIENFV